MKIPIDRGSCKNPVLVEALSDRRVKRSYPASVSVSEAKPLALALGVRESPAKSLHSIAHQPDQMRL